MSTCLTCAWPSRETVGMVCQTCGTDYAKPEPDAWRDTAGRIYVNLRKHPDASTAYDGDCVPLWLTPTVPPPVAHGAGAGEGSS